MWLSISNKLFHRQNFSTQLPFFNVLTVWCRKKCRIHLSIKLGWRSDSTVQRSEKGRIAKITRPTTAAKWKITSEHQWTCGSFWPPWIQWGAQRQCHCLTCTTRLLVSSLSMSLAVWSSKIMWTIYLISNICKTWEWNRASLFNTKIRRSPACKEKKNLSSLMLTSQT